MKKVKLGILGCGAISQYAHLPAAVKSKFIDLIAICDKNEDLVKPIAFQYQVPQSYTNHREFLSKADIEAVILAVPDPFHVPLALDCIQAGKHVLLEKPVAVNSEEALELLRLLKKTPLKILVGNMKRHDPGIEFARKFIVERIGRMLSVSGWYCDSALRPQLQETLLFPLHTSLHSKRASVNSKTDKKNYNLITHGIHLLNTLQFLSGPIRRITGKMTERFGSYSWHAVMDYKNGAIGHFELTVKVKSNWSEGFEVHGEFGSVTGKTFLPFFKRPSKVRAFDFRRGISEMPAGPDSDPYKRQLDSFAHSILEGTPVVCSVKDGIQDLKVLEAFKRSIDSMRWEEAL